EEPRRRDAARAEGAEWREASAPCGRCSSDTSGGWVSDERSREEPRRRDAAAPKARAEPGMRPSGASGADTDTRGRDRAVIRLSEKVIADPPVVLAPMAGITNVAFRRLCREYGAGLYISEMITSRALVERNPKTMRLIRFAPDERPRSLQLYGVDPAVVGAAVRVIVQDDLADHVDLNFGCPVPKVTRKGGGAALPWRMGLFAEIVTAAVRAAAGAVPVTVKMRLGID